MKKEVKDQVAEVFKSNKGIKELHVTDDGQCFTNLDLAVAHQNSIGKDGDDVETVNRSLEIVSTENETEQNNDQLNAAVLKAVDEAKEAAKVELDEAVEKAKAACKIEFDKELAAATAANKKVVEKLNKEIEKLKAAK